MKQILARVGAREKLSKRLSSNKRSVAKTSDAAAEGTQVTPIGSLRDLAYKEIKHRIITCVFKPGEYLNETYISTVLGLGRTPVHQAIDRLTIDGMVEVVPRKGVIVRPVSLDEVMQIIETRLHVEPWGVRMATARAEDKDILAMEDILSRADRSAKGRNVEQLMLLDREFHTILARASRNDILADILLKLHERSLRFWFISLVDAAHHAEVQDEHSLVLKAIKARDLDAAEGAMRSHIESFRKNIMRRL